MNRTAKILYAGFYDHPLGFTVRHQGALYLFWRDFSDDLDEYEDTYRVYAMPPMTDQDIQSSWLKLNEAATALLGEVPVKSVVFDETRRREIETAVLERLLADSPRPLVGAAR